jgi:hypothetical protein
MDNKMSEWFKIGVGVLCFGAFVSLFWMLYKLLGRDNDVIQLPVLVITGVMALFATLALVAVTFSVAGLTDPTQALGLPEGSVRAAIALSLIVIFAITSIYLYSSLSEADASSPGVDFAKQVFAVVGTLMTAVASFYFASRASATAAAPTVSSPELISIEPAQRLRQDGLTVKDAKIKGKNLELTKSVTLEKGATKVAASDVLSNAELITCTFTFDAGAPLGKYNVVATMSDGATATLPEGFDLTSP